MWCIILIPCSIILSAAVSAEENNMCGLNWSNTKPAKPDQDNEQTMVIDSFISKILTGLDLTHKEVKTSQDLEGVMINGTNLQVLNVTFNNQTTLKCLIINSNKVYKIVKGTFDNCGSLKYLYLNKNKLTILQDNLFRNLTNLETLDLSENCLRVLTRNIFSGLETLEHLNLSHNRINSIAGDAFDHVTSVTELSLANNELIELHIDQFEKMASLKDLVLKYNKISFVPYGIFRNNQLLVAIDLDNNQVKICDWLDKTFSPNLKILSLRNNFIQDVHVINQIEENTQIESVYLKNNRVSYKFPQVICNLNRLKFKDIECINNNIYYCIAGAVTCISLLILAVAHYKCCSSKQLKKNYTEQLRASYIDVVPTFANIGPRLPPRPSPEFYRLRRPKNPAVNDS